MGGRVLVISDVPAEWDIRLNGSWYEESVVIHRGSFLHVDQIYFSNPHGRIQLQKVVNTTVGSKMFYLTFFLNDMGFGKDKASVLSEKSAQFPQNLKYGTRYAYPLRRDPKIPDECEHYFEEWSKARSMIGKIRFLWRGHKGECI